MSRRIQTGATLLVLAAVVVMGLVGWTYRRDRVRYQLAYTTAVKHRDIADTARKAISALQDAELREQDYILTGETVYSEAYAQDVQDWQDESATLELMAQHDDATTLVRDLLKTGARAVNELGQIVSIYDSGSRDAALERIRKGSGIVYLEQARDTVAQIQEVDGGAADLAIRSLVGTALGSSGHLVAGSAIIFCLMLAGTLLLLFPKGRRERAGSSEASEKQSVAAGSSR